MASNPPPSLPCPYPSTDQVIAAAKAVARALRDGDVKYAVVGGAACLLLGSNRATTDVDFVVPKSRIRDARLLLKAQTEHFAVEPRTNHTVYLSTPPVEIQIIAPPALFKEPFDESTETVDVNGIQVLKPALILNAKCRSILGRAGESKKMSDAQDIKFLLHRCAEDAEDLTEVPNATKEFVDAYVAMYGGAELWRNLGCVVEG
ncbi:hypothetical protein C8A00DRAFT_35737 [Chaetomidium leptoderma]|uniref:Nucleotidyl transferase n=1 Tax=Chaetomidium leptoderma TaxID=669021 RepID=A0AAN6VJJ6_9PEZI|nr:hypothetical protein C8A00DRAFT_35737 [Chaetomidium leptoderma]